MQISALRDRVVAASLDFVWDEWGQMGVLATSRSTSRWAQDPEALLLFTLEVGRDDPRLFDEVLDWLAVNESQVSTRRLRTLCEDDEDRRLVDAALEWAKRQSRPATKPMAEGDVREAKELFHGGVPSFRFDPTFLHFGLSRPPVVRTGKSREPDPLAAINLAFRLRHLLGVGTRAEAIRFLLTADVEAATVTEVAASSAYSKRNIQEALTALVASGVVVYAGGGVEQRFALDPARWAYLLRIEPDAMPRYRDWPSLFAVLRKTLRWLADPELVQLTPYLLASRAADLVDDIRPALNRAGVLLPARMGAERAWSDLEDTVDYALREFVPSRSTAYPAAFQLVAESTGYRWRLRSETGRIVAMSAETYTSEAAARGAIDRLRQGAQAFSLVPVPDSGAIRWAVIADNGRILASSTESYATVSDAERAARGVRGAITGAALQVDTISARQGRASRHVVPRSDGRWEVTTEGATRASSAHATQAEAIDAARRLVRRAADGDAIVIHGRDGQIRSSEVHPRD